MRASMQKSHKHLSSRDKPMPKHRRPPSSSSNEPTATRKRRDGQAQSVANVFA
jgi:hypothetical protein